jgi:hypothetical protein
VTQTDKTERIKRKEERAEDRAAGRAVLWIFGVLFVTWGAYFVVAVALLLGHQRGLDIRLVPAIKTIAEVSGFGLFPLCLLLAASPKTRLVAGMGFFAISGIFTFVTAASCALYTHYVWSWFGLVFGTALVGYGIVPTGILAALTHHRLDIAGGIVSTTIMLFSTMYFGLALMTLSFSSAPMRGPTTDAIRLYWANTRPHGGVTRRGKDDTSARAGARTRLAGAGQRHF